MKTRYQISFFLHCICLCVRLSSYRPLPSYLSYEVIWIWHGFESGSLKQCNTEIPLPEIARCLLTPFLFWSAAASAMDRCTAVLILWHFHEEMDVVGSIRQRSDIYIRKNGCCWAREGRKEVGAAQRLSPHLHRCSLTVILPLPLRYRHGTWNIFFTTSALPASNGAEVMTCVSTWQPMLERG